MHATDAFQMLQNARIAGYAYFTYFHFAPQRIRNRAAHPIKDFPRISHRSLVQEAQIRFEFDAYIYRHECTRFIYFLLYFVLTYYHASLPLKNHYMPFKPITS